MTAGAELLREAAAKIRVDHRDEPPEGFMHSVANWLYGAAFGWDALDAHDRRAVAVARAYLGRPS